MKSRFENRRALVTAFVIASVAVLQHTVATGQGSDAADVERLVKALQIAEGSRVAEIGAGSGELTIAIARRVGASGRVFSNELNKERLAGIAKRVEDAGLPNVTVVEGKEDVANLPEGCCDAIFMRNVYHHFGDPPSMNGSLLNALKPGGRLAVIDFTPPPPPGGENPPGRRGEDNHHGITAPTLERELKAAGFEILSSDAANRSVFVVARRPGPATPDSTR